MVLRSLAISSALSRRLAWCRDAGSARSDAGAGLRRHGGAARRGRTSFYNGIRPRRPHGAHQLPDALDYLCHVIVRVRVRAVVADGRVEGDADRGGDHCGTDPAQRVVAVPLPVRAGGVDLAPTHLRAADLGLLNTKLVTRGIHGPIFMRPTRQPGEDSGYETSVPSFHAHSFGDDAFASRTLAANADQSATRRTIQG